ncbi:MAG: hypothetical protein ACE5HC_16660 [Candidatus Binatia bacterium]
MNLRKSQGKNATYGISLRAIGQDLERRDLKCLDLEVAGNTYRIRGWYGTPLPQAAVELCYTYEDIDSLEGEGQGKRHDPAGMPDFLSLTGILRTVGAYVDERCGCLLAVSKREESVTICYLTRDGDRRKEEHSISSIYEISVKLFKQRRRIGGSTDRPTGLRFTG